MRPIEKIREDLAYWEAQERQGREMVAAAQSMLPGIRKTLQELEAMGREEPGPAPADPSPPPPEHSGGGDTGSGPKPHEARPEPDQPKLPEAPLKLRGQCEDQVEQALEAKSPQSPADLKEFLAEHGQAYSRGAINYALRNLRNRGKIQEAHKEGNLRYYEPAKMSPAA